VLARRKNRLSQRQTRAEYGYDVNETGQKSVKGLRHQELNPLPRAAKEIPMKRSILQLTALALILTTTGIANARGGNSGGSKGSFSKSSSMSSNSYKYNSMNSSSYKNFSKSSSYCKPYGKCYYNSSFYCSHKCYCDCFGCYCYWYPTDNCWCLWYQPWGCYIPWSTYCTLVTPATAVQPTIGQTAVAQAPTPPAPPSGN
jgi:hypothetical protein